MTTTIAETGCPTPFVLHYEMVRRGSKYYGFIASAVGENKPTVMQEALKNGKDDLEGLMVQEFRRCWDEHPEHQHSMVLYTTSPILRKLLNEQHNLFPGLMLRSVATGPALTATWSSARAALTDSIRAFDMQREEHRRMSRKGQRMVVATDASKGTHSSTIGWAAACSDGQLRSGSIHGTSIEEGEFHAVQRAINTFATDNLGILDVLTDSLEVYRFINLPHIRQRIDNPCKRATACLEAIERAQHEGIVVNVHWVRGHNGHVLNDFADRAAVNARRCAQWRLGQAHSQSLEAGIRSELDDEMRGVNNPARLLPDFVGDDARKAKAA